MSFVEDTVFGTIASLVSQPAPVILGPLTLTGPEAPSRITIGGRQLASIHKMPGGGRVIDVMGADDGAVCWRGMFIGPTAASRVRMIDAIRTSGTPCAFSFGDYSFRVLIVDFQYSYEARGAVISYCIRAEKSDSVVPASTATAWESALLDCSMATQFLSNTKASLAAYSGVTAGSLLAGASAAIASSSSVLGQAGASGAQSQPASALTDAIAAIIGAVPSLSTGALSGTGNGFSIATGGQLMAVVQNSGALAAAVQAGGYVNRAAASLAASAADHITIGFHS